MWHTIVAWAGTALQVAGAAGLATRFLHPRSAYGVMLPGTAIWLSLAIAASNWPLAAMQAVFAFLNLTGFVRWKH